jgi:hypothetical protein
MNARLTATLIAGLLVAAPALASEPFQQGEARFGVTFLFLDPPGLRRESRVLLEAGSGQHVRGTVGDVHISIPGGIELVSGDTLRHPHVSSLDPKSGDGRWEIVVRPIAAGHYLIRGYIKIPRARPDAWDETERVLDLDVRADTTIASTYTTYQRRIEDGQRFRYGGRYMVLLDSGDAGDHGAITEGPQVFDHPAGVCGHCGLSEPKVIKLAVTVGRRGRVTWIAPRQESLVNDDPRVVAAAKTTVRRWRFRPARASDGQAVAQWAVVDVVVEPRKK